METLTGILSNCFAPIPVMELAAIWLPNAVITSKGKTQRIATGDGVSISENNELQNLNPYPTHTIIKCMGRPTTDFHIVVKNLDSGEESIVYI